LENQENFFIKQNNTKGGGDMSDNDEKNLIRCKSRIAMLKIINLGFVSEITIICKSYNFRVQEL
jgi:hypothetical protein